MVGNTERISFRNEVRRSFVGLARIELAAAAIRDNALRHFEIGGDSVPSGHMPSAWKTQQRRPQHLARYCGHRMPLNTSGVFRASRVRIPVMAPAAGLLTCVF